MGRREQLIHLYTVSYDDTQQAEHLLDDPEKRAWVLPLDEQVRACWQRLPFRCIISRQRLTEPARGELCRHPALCNQEELRAYVGRMKKCPVAFCTAKLTRTSAVELDLALQSQLVCLPEGVEHFWYGPAGEVEDALGPHEAPRKRKRPDVVKSEPLTPK